MSEWGIMIMEKDRREKREEEKKNLLIRVHHGESQVFRANDLLCSRSQVCRRLWRDFIGRWAHWARGVVSYVHTHKEKRERMLPENYTSFAYRGYRELETVYCIKTHPFSLSSWWKTLPVNQQRTFRHKRPLKIEYISIIIYKYIYMYT